MIDGFASGELAGALLATIRQMLIGWVLASIVGVGVGTLIGSSRWARRLIEPTLEFIRPLPASALAPIAIVLFGLTETMVLALIAFGTSWPMLLATVHGFSSVSPRLIEVGRALDLGRVAVIWKIILPNALPDIAAAMRLGLTVALVLAIVGEMVSGQPGLGRQILLAARSFQSAELYAGVILLGFLGLASNLLLAAAERKLLRWEFVQN